MNLSIKGNEEEGFWVEIGQNRPVLTGYGEFSAVFMSPETGEREETSEWRANRVERNSDFLKLTGEIELTLLDASIDVQVTYRLVNEKVVKKEVVFTSDQNLSYSLSVETHAKIEPENYWTFERSTFPGGPVYEIFPAMGMKINGVNYGFLTDNGYRNKWTRVSRQADGLGFLIGLEKQPDAEFMSISTQTERNNEIHRVQYQFGEFLDYSKREYKEMKAFGEWKPIHEEDVLSWSEETIQVSGSNEGEKGVYTPTVLDKNGLYEIDFEYRSNAPLSLRLLDSGDKSYFEWAKELGAYRDQIEATSGDEWKSFKKCFFTSRLKELRQTADLKIMQHSTGDEPYHFEIRNVKIRKYEGQVKPYHPLESGKRHRISLFIFEEPSTAHRDIQIASQVSLAEGLGFEGTQEEKIMYADNQMLVWIAQHDRLVPHVVPSLNYHPDMYLRDTFWEVSAVFDKEVSVQCWQRYAEKQHPDGQLDTLARAYHYAPSVDDNDSTMFFIMWAYLNWKRYGMDPPKEPLKKALDNIRNLHCQDRDGRYISRTAGWFDTIWGDPCVTAINQGHFAVVLQCAKEIGLDVTEEEISFAKQAYRSLYDPSIGYVRWSEQADYLSPSVLMGEFMNLWLFGEGILTDEAVLETIEKLPVIKRGVPCIADKNGQLFTDDNKPWEQKYAWRKGVYHNGGSWFLYEYLAYAAAARHGWESAQERMNWRMEMEFSKEDEPYSHEFIPLTDDEDDWWKTCRVFGWNTFAIVANQVANGASESTLKNPVRPNL